MLFGIKDNTGLGNNAEELKTASILNNNVVIKPFQELLIDSFDHILAYNGISLNLYFETLQPLEFQEDLLESTDITNDQKEEETGVEMSKHFKFDEKKIFETLSELGEDEDLQNWQIVDERPVDYDQEEVLDKMIGLASTGIARPNAKSEQDAIVDDMKFKVRYQYAPQITSKNSREFCKNMIENSKIYRKEDIIKMGEMPVNAGWGPNGAATYDVWFYKGGGDCAHFWMRKTYMAVDVDPDVKNPKAEISVNEAKKEGFTPEVNDPKVAKRPRDMKNRGFLKPRG